MLDAHDETLFGLVMLSQFMERTEFPSFGPLAVIHVEACQAIVFIRHCSGDTTVHTTAYEHYSKFSLHGPVYQD